MPRTVKRRRVQTKEFTSIKASSLGSEWKDYLRGLGEPRPLDFKTLLAELKRAGYPLEDHQMVEVAKIEAGGYGHPGNSFAETLRLKEQLEREGKTVEVKFGKPLKATDL